MRDTSTDWQMFPREKLDQFDDYWMMNSSIISGT